MLQLSVTGINWVRQRDHKGCVLACFAMITGMDYYAVRTSMSQHDFSRHGVSVFESDRWLWEHGYATLRKFRENLRHTPSDKVWPPYPWAEIHVCTVSLTDACNESHMVVMLGNGDVLDPLFEERKRLTDYKEVLNVTGVYRV